MGIHSKTALPSTSRRAKTTDPDRSSLKRTNNSNAAKKRARRKPSKSDSKSIYDSDACALYRSRQKFPNRGIYHVAPDRRMSHDDCSQAGHSCTCVIALRHSRRKVIDEDSSKLAYVGQWSASLWDAGCMSHRDMHDPFVQGSTNGSNLSTRDLMIRSCQINARRFGFSHCEVRVYVGTSDNYVPLFGGPLPAST